MVDYDDIDVSSSSLGQVSSTDDGYEGGGAQKEEDNEVNKLAEEDTKQIWVWKTLVIGIIIITATLVATGTYKFLQEEEDSDFNDSYDQFVNTIRDSSEFHAHNIFQSLRSFSATITVEANALNATFPFVTIPAFEALGAGVRSATGAELINWHVRVEHEQLGEWNRYVNENYEESLAQSRAIALTLDVEGSSVKPSDYIDGPIAPFPYMPNFEEGGIILAPTYGEGPYFPAWMTSPPIFNPNFINSDPYPWVLKDPINAVLDARELVLTDTVAVGNLANRAIKLEDHEAFHASLVDYVQNPETTAFEHPHSNVMVPVFAKLNDPTSKIVGTFAVVLPWDRYLVKLLPEGVDGITCVLRNSCGKAYTYKLDGNSAFYVGEGDSHDHAYNHTEVELPFRDYIQRDNDEKVEGECMYSFHIFATKEFDDEYRSSLPISLTLVVTATFAAMIITFLVYDSFVRQRNNKVVGHATLSNAIVSSLFPSNVRDRLMEEKKADEKTIGNNKNRLKSFLTEDRHSESPALASPENGGTVYYKTKPIADLFPSTTILFADIAGFTEWSSTREPSQVFTLLETIYHEFDRIARRRGVFKVETVGDCYVAVTGLPEPRKDHAVVMARFARDCVNCMGKLMRNLEMTLGPGTVDLVMRVGMHSGSVTAGVLRGEKSRFQLFGDTMNTASRMESTGRKNKIQVSEETADLLVAAGKRNWVTPREDVILAKGKGEMSTFWLAAIVEYTDETPSDDHTDRLGNDETLVNGVPLDTSLSKEEPMIKWNVEILMHLLREVVQGRKILGKLGEEGAPNASGPVKAGTTNTTPIGEVPEFIPLVSSLQKTALSADETGADLESLNPQVEAQLTEYVTGIASMYRDNPAHNFDQASHVTLSAHKLLSCLGDVNPIVAFATVFSALIHGVDHMGLTNEQLISENPKLAAYYKVAISEQNSIDLAWDLLMDTKFSALRQTIYQTDQEATLFRQLVVTLVLATDVTEPSLHQRRQERWEQAFSANVDNKEDRQYTLALEYLMQVSNNAHTMQHWNIYCKWNKLFFEEHHQAYQRGAATQPPSNTWYESELELFDSRIIPLAQKLQECGFGDSSQEYLKCALTNRKNWEEQGRSLLEALRED